MSAARDFTVQPIAAAESLRAMVYRSLKDAIADLDLYGRPGEVRLDERAISRELGVSRTPVRQAFAMLEHEGLLRSEARRGVFVVRRTRDEIVEVIHAWAALESMAARLACARASDADLAALRPFVDGPPGGVAAYAEANVRFHGTVMALSQCGIFEAMAANLRSHIRGVRVAAMQGAGRVERSRREHAAIVAALQARDGARAEHLVREHALGLVDVV
jgi:DNA-binding GntR family transcriptional regulator